MDLHKYKATSGILGALLILVIPAYLLIRMSLIDITPTESTGPEFTGKESCKECHIGEYQDWEGSHHYRAMDVANDSTVLGNFSDVKFESGGRTHEMYKKDDRFFVYTDGEDGEMEEFEAIIK